MLRRSNYETALNEANKAVKAKDNTEKETVEKQFSTKIDQDTALTKVKVNRLTKPMRNKHRDGTGN